MSVKLNVIIGAINRIAPENLAEDWDNVGLQVGSRQQLINRILLTLDVTESVVTEAVNRKADLILAHHPFIFNGLKTLATDHEKGRNIEKLIKNDISVYVAHTNLDKAEFGLNQYLADLLGLENITTLEPADPEVYYKIVVFTPLEATNRIVEVMGKNGAGSLGNYDSCTYRTNGIGTFRPLEGSAPYIGTENQLVSVAEDRIEAIVKRRDIKNLISQVKKNHPYEEMAYDVIPLENGRFINQSGLGKMGILKEAVDSTGFIELLKNRLKLESLRGAGAMPQKIKRVAICSGAGADLIGLAKSRRADVLVTGDLKHHDGQRALENNFWVLDAGHYGTEKWAKSCFKKILQQELGEECPELMVAETQKDFLIKY
jgi:dinuclear metal center YbgI/SA1388 family protein